MGDSWIYCPYCEERYDREWALETHIKDTHAFDSLKGTLLPDAVMGAVTTAMLADARKHFNAIVEDTIKGTSPIRGEILVHPGPKNRTPMAGMKFDD